MTELLFILFTGLAFGSFITCASYRLPLGIDVVKKPSFCPQCNTKLGFKDLWPVASWVAFRGTCRHCHAKIPARYPAIELATAAVFLLLYSQYGFTLTTLILALMAVMLLIMIVADLEHYIIPDSVHVVLLPLGVLYHWQRGTPWDEPLAGFLLASFIGLALHYGYGWIRKKDVLGFGDVKFLAVVGLWLGLAALPFFLFLAGLLGVAFGLIWRALTKSPVFPFGPSLAAALFVCVVFPSVIDMFWDIGGLIIK